MLVHNPVWFPRILEATIQHILLMNYLTMFLRTKQSEIT